MAKSEKGSSSENTTSRAVDRALSMLELIGDSKTGLSNADLSRRLKIPKSSASYILRVLENRAYLRRGDDGKYVLGMKLMSLAGDNLSHMDVREVAKPELEAFLRRSRLPEAHLAVLDNGRAVYIDKVESPDSFIKMDIWVGHRLPVHTTAIGKVLVASLPEEKILEILKQRGMETKTQRSIRTPQGFLREAKKIKKYGFAVDNEENSPGVRCIAAPIRDANGNVIAALGTSSTILEIDTEHLPRYVELVKEAALKVSRQLGYTEP
ncbi:MAG: IclR family transcriptional regulator [Aridibacter famidurans]|nr:IclR family transcriptional regulator [Aridibacter famidurans]